MSISESLQWVDVDDYLRGEQDGQVRHEFVAGRVYAMTGGSVYHNRIAGTFFAMLREKRAAYQGLESLREYLLLEQDRAEARLICRLEGGTWEEVSYGLGDVIRLESLDLYIGMQQVYEGAWC